MTANNEITYILPSLLELAYHACSEIQQKQYDELPVPSVDLQICCRSILKVLKVNSDVNLFNPHGDRRSIYPKVQRLVQSQFSDIYVINDICEMAAFNGHIECMKLARAIGVPCYSPTISHKSACDQAAEAGNLECLIYACTNGAQLSLKTCSYASSNGHLECLVYMHENGFFWDQQTCYGAAVNGQMECLVDAHENGCPWDSKMCNAAVYGGLEILKYCKENGCPWDDDTCFNAVVAGSLECLKYARENGSPWDESVCDEAAWSGNLECLKYAFENGCEWDFDSFLPFFPDPAYKNCWDYAFEVRSRMM